MFSARGGVLPDIEQMQVDLETTRLVERAQVAWEALKRVESWDQWRVIGEAISAGRRDVMRYLGLNQPAGASYSRTMGQWLARYGFDAIDKGTRSRLQSCLDNGLAIEEWRKGLSQHERLQYTHPNTIWRKWNASRNVGDEAEKPPRVNAKDESIRELQEQLDRTVKERDDWRRQAEEAARKLAALEAGQEGAEAPPATKPRRRGKTAPPAPENAPAVD